MKTTIDKITRFYNEYPQHKGTLYAETRFGYKRILESAITLKDSKWLTILLDNDMCIECARDHRLFLADWEYAKNLKIGDEILTKYGTSKIVNISLSTESEDLYDLQIEEVEEFYANEIVSHNSCIIDVLVYAIYGKSIEGLKDNDLINNINLKNMEIELIFKKDSKYYRILRHRKTKDGNGVKIYESTSISFTDDDEISLDSIANTNRKIEEIIGISYELFIRVACFSANHTPFFELSARSGNSNQSSIIEELFELLEMAENAEILKAQTKENNQLLMIEETKVDQLEQEKERLDKQLETAQSRLDKWDDTKKSNIETYSEILENIKDIDFDKELETHEKVKEQKSNIEVNSVKLASAKKDISVNLKTKSKLETEIKSLYDSKCPYCEQFYNNAELVNKLEESIQETFDIIEAKKQVITELLDDKDEYTSKLTEYSENCKFPDFNTAKDLAFKQKTISSKIEELNDEINPYVENLEELKNIDLSDLNYNTINTLKKSIEHEIFLYKLLTNKNSFIRKTLLNKHIPYLNGRLYFYLNELDLPHIVEFGHDLSAKISKFGKKLEFGNLSNGQKSRVNLALSLSFRDILQKIYGKINICMLDEVLDYGLDSIGVELAAKLLKQKSNNENISLYIITHKEELTSCADNIVTVTMENNFSYI